MRIKWQDLVFTIGGFLFAPALIATIIAGVAIPAATSLVTALVLTVFVYAYLRMGFYLSAFSTALTAGCWWVILIIL